MQNEQFLLDKIDIKYYRNNPDYIKSWQNYYYDSNKDVMVLFLMKYKNISGNFHWLYIELSKFFKRKNKENISVYILKEAILKNVYNVQVLQNELDLYRNVQCASTKEVHKYLNPVGFYVLGKTWNCQVVKCYHDESIFGKYKSFEEYRLCENFLELLSKRPLINTKTQMILYTGRVHATTYNWLNYKQKTCYKILRNYIKKRKLTDEKVSLKRLRNDKYYKIKEKSSSQKFKLIDLVLFLKTSSEIVKLYYFLKVYLFLLKNNFCIKDLKELVLDLNFNIRSITLDNSVNSATASDVLEYSFMHDVSSIPKIFEGFYRSTESKNLSCKDFMEKCCDILRRFNYKREVFKYHLFILENINFYVLQN